MAIEIRPARRTDVPDLGRVLARAFQEDPVFRWLQPDPDRRAATTPGFFAAMARHHFLGGGSVEVAVSETGLGAATLWNPPGRRDQHPLEQIAMLPAVVRAFRGRLGAARALDNVMKENHPEEPHWYLAVIGSDPLVRGAGFGQALMRSRLERCDAEGAPAYLESSHPDNIPYYMRFGFDLMNEFPAPGGGPPLFPMWREPRSS